ncbi:MAG: S8 family serine peptidase [Candidatus Eisenbacteria bacterium]
MLRPRSAVRVFAISVGLLLFSSGSSMAQEALVQLDPDRISVMFMHGVVDLPNEMAPAPLDSVAFFVPEVEQLMGDHGVLRVEKIFKGFAPHDTLRQARTGEMVRVIDLSQIFLLHLDGERSLDALVGALEEEPSVVFAERLPILEPDAWDDPPANDAMLENDHQWGLFNTGQHEDSVRHADIDVKRAWQLQTGSEDILLGIIDTGVCYDHPDLSPTPGALCFGAGCIVVGGFNLIDPDGLGCSPTAGEDPYDYCCPPLWSEGHGTMVASAAAGITNNRTPGTWDGGAAGVAGGWQDEYGGGSTGSRILSYRAPWLLRHACSGAWFRSR